MDYALFFKGVASLAAMIVLFLIFREVVCWYWKINERKQLMEDIKDQLILMNHKLSSGDIPEAVSAVSDKEALKYHKRDSQGRYIIP